MSIVRNFKDSQEKTASLRRNKGLPGYELIITDKNNVVIKSGIYATENGAYYAMTREMNKPIEEV